MGGHLIHTANSDAFFFHTPVLWGGGGSNQILKIFIPRAPCSCFVDLPTVGKALHETIFKHLLGVMATFAMIGTSTRQEENRQV